MLGLDDKKKQEINDMVTILMQLGLAEIRLLNRDANTLLALKEEKERENGLIAGNKLGRDERMLA